MNVGPVWRRLVRGTVPAQPPATWFNKGLNMGVPTSCLRLPSACNLSSLSLFPLHYQGALKRLPGSGLHVNIIKFCKLNELFQGFHLILKEKSPPS